jgi:hypothetical protein
MSDREDNEPATPEPERDNEEERSDDETIDEHDAQSAKHHRESFGMRHRPHLPEEGEDQNEDVSATIIKPAADVDLTYPALAFMFVVVAIAIGLLLFLFIPTSTSY